MKRARSQIEADIEPEGPWKRMKTQQSNPYGLEREMNCNPNLCGNCESVMTASKANHVHCLNELLNQCTKANSTQVNGTRNALFYAIGQGYVNCVRILLDFDSDVVNSYQESGIAPLHLSAGAGHVEIMRELIKRGADVNLRLETDQLNPLHICASFGALDCLNLLLENGVDPHLQTSDSSMNALHFAAYHGNIECLKALLSKGANINAVSEKSHRSVLHYAMCCGKLECFEFLVQNGADVSLVDKHGHSALICAPLNELSLNFNCMKYFSLNERKKWFSFAAVDVERKPHKFETKRNNLLHDFKEIFLEINNLIHSSSLFERIPILEFCFSNEIGTGVGVMRECFSNLCEEISESCVLESCENPKYHQFTRCSTNDNLSKNEERLIHASFLGMIFALALIYGHVVPINLPPFIFKFLFSDNNNNFHENISINDIELIDNEFYRQLLFLKNCSSDEIKELDLYFTTPEIINNTLCDIDLIPDGSKIQVTKENMNEYLNILSSHKLLYKREDALHEFIHSFHRVIPNRLISPIFTCNEISIMLMGNQEISIDDWKKNTIYCNCSPSRNEIIWFWELIELFSIDDRRSLLSFCTGAKYLPIGGFKRLLMEKSAFTIQFQENLPIGTLPTSRTCFNTLILPSFETKEKLKQAFEFVIKQQEAGVGFAFV